MSVTPFDSALYRDLMGDADLARLFSDSADIRAMLIVWGALARAQGAHRLIPETAAAFLHRATLELQIDPAGLAPETGTNGVCVPALLAATRKALEAPEHAAYLHWGATSQDIIDTGLALRLRQALALIADRLDMALDRLAALADAQAETPMAARTYGQVATPTTFGAVVAGWGEGLLAVRDTLPQLRERVEIVTLSGAAGTLSVMDGKGPAIRAEMARALALGDPCRVPHADRSHVAELAAWLTRLATACGKVATDLLLLTRDGDVALGGGGASSTMPQKANPVAPSVIRALAAHATGLNATLQSGAMTWDQRDGASWFAEWLALPQLVVAAGKAVGTLSTLEIAPTEVMARRARDPSGLIHAEAVAFALAEEMPRAEAQARTKALAGEIRAEGGNLILRAGLDPADFAPDRQWGEAPAIARAFAATIRGD